MITHGKELEDWNPFGKEEIEERDEGEGRVGLADKREKWKERKKEKKKNRRKNKNKKIFDIKEKEGRKEGKINDRKKCEKVGKKERNEGKIDRKID